MGAVTQDVGKYNRGARTLHWLSAFAIIANLASGLLHEPLDGVVSLMPWHKALGMTILFLSAARLLWRMGWRAPPYPPTMRRAEVLLAKAVHVILYVLMIAMPLSGWAMSSAGTYPLTWFGLFDLPKLPLGKESLAVLAGRTFHGTGGWVLLVLVLGHATAALRHHFVLKDEVLRRMI